MQRKNFNDNWTFYSGSCTMLEQLQGAETGGTPVTLPHDAMIHEPRTSNTKNTSQTGFCPGGNYEYRKTFDVPADWVDKTAILEFEGVYQTAMVYVNDALAAATFMGTRIFTYHWTTGSIMGRSTPSVFWLETAMSRTAAGIPAAVFTGKSICCSAGGSTSRPMVCEFFPATFPRNLLL